MPRVEFEPTIPVLERANAVQTLDRATTVIGRKYSGTYLALHLVAWKYSDGTGLTRFLLCNTNPNKWRYFENVPDTRIRLPHNISHCEAWDLYPTFLLYRNITRRAQAHWDWLPQFWGGTMPQVGRSRVRIPMRSLDFSIDLILLAALRPWGRLNL
jgi:hypothetical protein